MRCVGVVPRVGKVEAGELCREVCGWLAARGYEPLVEREADVPGCPSAPGAELAERAELLVVLGGDGTLLHAARISDGREIPILGVNLGTLGFLTEVPRDRVYPMLERALAGELAVSRRLMLQVEVRAGNGERRLSGSVLNDVAISKNALSKLARLEVTVDGTPAATYEADGIVVATPTGSTGYSLAAAGPIVYPTHEAIVLTPICPHALTQRPLVLPATLPIRLKLVSSGEMFVTLDGHSGRPLETGDEVLVHQAAHRTLLLRNPEVDPFEILRRKLRWGAR